MHTHTHTHTHSLSLTHTHGVSERWLGYCLLPAAGDGNEIGGSGACGLYEEWRGHGRGEERERREIIIVVVVVRGVAVGVEWAPLEGRGSHPGESGVDTRPTTRVQVTG